MFFLGYLVFYSALSLLIDVSIFFSILSFVLGGTLYFNSNSPLQGSTSCNFLSISIATVIFSIPIWYIIVKTNIIEIKSSPLYVFIPSLLISWAILFKIVDRIFIHNRETKEVVLEDYFTIHRSRRDLTHIYIFKFKNSSDLYSTGMFRQRIFIDKIGSKFSCTFGKGIFGTSYITSIKLIKDAGIDTSENQTSHSF